jgi:hypothetical protein
MSMNLFERVAKEAGQKLASEADVKVLKKLQADWERARETISGTGVDSAFNCWANEQRNAALAAKAGKLHEFRTHSREEMEQDFLRRGESAREHMRTITAEAVPICRRAAEKFAETAHEVAARIEKAEAAAHADFGVSYSPSGLTIALRQLPDRARRMVPTSEYAQSSPASMVPFLNIN